MERKSPKSEVTFYKSKNIKMLYAGVFEKLGQFYPNLIFARKACLPEALLRKLKQQTFVRAGGRAGDP